MVKRRKLIIANWKNNPASIREAVKLAQATDQEGLVICPPEKWLFDVAPLVKKGKLGAQDLFWKKDNPPVKVEYVIVGHSDRRYGLRESDKIVAQKFITAIETNIVPVLCVGETWEQRQRGERGAAIEKEIISAFCELQSLINTARPIYVAYEPVWAISTSPYVKENTPEDAVAAIRFIKGLVAGIVPSLTQKVRFIYGGSINGGNAESFLRQSEIEGILIGRASLNPKEINKVAKTALSI